MAKRRETIKHLEAFEAWYAEGRSFRRISQNLAVPERTLYGWGEWFNWHERADKRDEQARRIADEEAAKERAERQRKRREAASLLVQRGAEYFQEKEIEDPKDAIQAIKAGTEIERKEDGLPDWVLMILNASPDDLQAIERSLTSSLAGGEAAGEDVDSLSPESESDDE